MWKSLLTTCKSEILRLNWRRRAKQKCQVGLRISDVAAFFRELNAADIPYVVLRWFDEVPLTSAAEDRFDEDIDILVDGLSLREALSTAFRHRGQVRCDLYSDSGMRGTTYLKMPYYPPELAARILASRVLHAGGFAVPEPRWHLLSLVYHLVYHKGQDAGIPTGIDQPVAATPKRDYAERLQVIAAEAGLQLPDELTLIGLHEWLKPHACDAPVDLMSRWPKPTPWHRALIAREMDRLKPWADRLPHLYLFLIREDADNENLTSVIEQQLADRFAVLRSVPLSDEQIEQAMLRIRGGNWIEHKRTTVIKPVRAVVCYDFAPRPVAMSPPAANNVYPFVENENVFVKHEIRDELNRIRQGARPLHALHGSDNAFETQHMIAVLWSDEAERVNHELLDQVTAQLTAAAA